MILMKHFFSKFSNAAPIAGNSLRDLSPWPILYKLDLYSNKTFSKVVSGIKIWPQLNADLPVIASGVQAPGQFCTNWTYMVTKPYINRLSQGTIPGHN